MEVVDDDLPCGADVELTDDKEEVDGVNVDVAIDIDEFSSSFGSRKSSRRRINGKQTR